MLVTLDQMKEYLGIPLADPDWDEFLEQQINTISETIEYYCRRKFSVTEYIQTFYLDELRRANQELSSLRLYQFPVVSIVSIRRLDEEGIVQGDPLTKYRVHKPTATLTNRHYLPFFSESDTVQVRYSAGFAEIPAPITNAVFSLVEERYNKKKNGIDLNFGSDIQSISIPGTISVAYDYSLQNNERNSAFGAVLGKYANTLDYFRSERAVFGSLELAYNDTL